MVEPEQVALAEAFGTLLELVDGGAAEVRRGDHRADAGAGVDVGNDPSLIQGTQHTDVREALEPTAAEDQRDASSHGCLRRPDRRRWAQHVRLEVKCRARLTT